VAAVAATVLAAWAPPATAVGPEGVAVEAAKRAAEAADIAAGPETSDVSFGEISDDGYAVAAAGAELAVVAPMDAGAPIAIEAGRDEARDIGIGLPATASAEQAEIIDGNAVYVDEQADTTFVVEAQGDGARVMSVLHSPEAPTQVNYDLDLPEGFELVARPDGSVDVAALGQGVEVIVATIEAPWAVDAAGAQVATHYTVSGGDLTQVVEPTAETTFPVTADPQIVYKWWGAVVRYTSRETILIGASASGCALAASFIPDATISKVVAAVCGGLAIVADTAAATGKCHRLNVHYFPQAVYPWVGTC
jgi:hypothetical protein